MITIIHLLLTLGLVFAAETCFAAMSSPSPTASPLPVENYKPEAHQKPSRVMTFFLLASHQANPHKDSFKPKE